MQQRDNQYEKALKTLDLLEEIVTKDMEGTTDIGSLTDKEKRRCTPNAHLSSHVWVGCRKRTKRIEPGWQSEILIAKMII